MSLENDRRDSKALEPELISDPTKKAEAEARNGLRQYDAGIKSIQTALDRGAFKLRPSLILTLHREALAGISSYSGNYRPAGVRIEKSKHEPPGAYLVPEFVEELCDYVNEHWDTATPIHLTSYVMWRLNWVHPFADGNGRTSRIASYVVLSIRAGYVLPGTPTIPDQIVDNRAPYFDALDAADAAYTCGKIDVSIMEDLIGALLATQLMTFYKAAGGKLPGAAGGAIL
jgi:Fic family protein